MTTPQLQLPVVNIGDDRGALHWSWRQYSGRDRFGHAVVPLWWYRKVVEEAERYSTAVFGRRLPRSGHGGVGARFNALNGPDADDWLLPDWYAGEGALDGPVAVYEPPHPLALTADECDRLIDSAYAWGGGLPGGAAGEQVEVGGARVGLIGDVAMQVRLYELAVVANHCRWRRPMKWQTGQVLRYRTGDSMGWHSDDPTFAQQTGEYAAALDDPVTAAGAAAMADRTVSCIAQLSDPDSYKGGAVEFALDGGTTVALPRTRGTVAVFTADTVHQVDTVESGERFSVTAFFEHHG